MKTLSDGNEIIMRWSVHVNGNTYDASLSRTTIYRNPSLKQPRPNGLSGADQGI